MTGKVIEFPEIKDPEDGRVKVVTCECGGQEYMLCLNTSTVFCCSCGCTARDITWFVDE